MNKKTFVLLGLILVLALPSLADPGDFGLGINYGFTKNSKMWVNTAANSGSMLQVAYSYDFTYLYTAELAFGFIADDNVFGAHSLPVNTETAAYLKVSHLFHTLPAGPFWPYLKVSTGIFGVNAWSKESDGFHFSAHNFLADVELGAGADFKLGDALLNVDLLFPALLHEWNHASPVSYIISFGTKWYFSLPKLN